MALSFPASPTVGQIHSEAGRSWRWTGTTWDSVHVSTDPVASLGGVTNTAAARANLGLGSAAVEDVGAFATAAQGTLADGAVPVSLIDAAGDLIIGTAADTAGRLAVGPSGRVLTSDGTTATWGRPWLASQPSSISAVAFGGGGSVAYATPGQRTASTGHGLVALNRETWSPVWLDAGTYDLIGVRSTTAAVSTWQLGVDSDSGAFAPGANILDAGTVNMNAVAGFQVLSISMVIATAGIYWTRARATAYTATPAASLVDGTTGHSWASYVCRGWPSDSFNYPRAYVGYYGLGATAWGAPVITGYSNTVPTIWLRKAS